MRKTLVITEPSRFLLKAVSRNLVGLVLTINLIFGWCEFMVWNNSSISVFFFPRFIMSVINDFKNSKEEEQLITSEWLFGQRKKVFFKLP